jgi:hypothetical protein
VWLSVDTEWGCVATGSEVRAREVARSESSFRDSNERFRRIALSYRFEPEDHVPFVCECCDPGCFECVMLGLAEYDRMRAHPSWFLLVAGHEEAEAIHERIVEAEHGYAIVEKTGIAGAEAALLHQHR